MTDMRLPMGLVPDRYAEASRARAELLDDEQNAMPPCCSSSSSTRGVGAWFAGVVTAQIRLATRGDVGELVGLEAGLFAADAGEHDELVDTTWPERRGVADFEALLVNEKALVLVAVDAAGVCGHLVGWVSEASEVRRGVATGYLRSLFVEERARRNGVASALVERFVAWAEGEHGAVTVSVTAYAENRDARAFYADLGFETLSVVLTRTTGLGQR
ncbi:N-acetyltransferase family protein [Kribbella sp. NPDC054772]